MNIIDRSPNVVGMSSFWKRCCLLSVGLLGLGLMAQDESAQDPSDEGGERDASSEQFSLDISDELLDELGLDDLDEPVVLMNEVGAFGTYSPGVGHLSFPVGGAFALLAGDGFSVGPEDRDVTFAGTSLSYSRGSNLFFDFNYFTGTTKDGEVTRLENFDELDYNVDETWYQFYLKYVPSYFRKTPYKLALKTGFSAIQYSMDYSEETVGFASVSGNIDYEDYLLNLGFALDYPLNIFRNNDNFSIAIISENEFFVGQRSQAVAENLFVGDVGDVASVRYRQNLKDLAWGFNGQLSARISYVFGDRFLWKLYLDGGVRVNNTRVRYRGQFGDGSNSSLSYDQFGTQTDLVYGPFVRGGIAVAF